MCCDVQLQDQQPHCMHKFQNLPSCNHYHCYIFALTGLAILGWTDQSSTPLTWELSSLNVYPFWFITGSLMLPCPVQCWDFGAAKSLYCPGLREQVAYPLAYNYKMVYGLLFINLIKLYSSITYVILLGCFF